jgi:D-glycero-beta-D-manno-heptose-7-phosphate kinase
MVDIDAFLNAFARISDVRILVVGDFIVDVYSKGSVNRISPEAPVMVFKESENDILLGGAANVALGMKKLGVDVKFISRIGDDSTAKIGLTLLEAEGIETSGIFIQKDHSTTQKTRLLSNNQQVMRIDRETCEAMPGYLEDCLFDYFNELMQSIDLIAISDYSKGFLSDILLSRIIQVANQKKCLVIVDPKGSDFSKYNGAYLLKPNQKEAFEAAGVLQDQDIGKAFESLQSLVGIERLLVTRSEKGMTYFTKKSRTDFQVEERQVIDATGAGDSCLVILSICLALNMSISQAIQLSNIVARQVVESVGCHAVTLADLIELVFKQSAKNVMELKSLKIIHSLNMFDEYVLLKVEQRIVDFKGFIEGIYQIKSVGQKILVLVDQELEDQFHLLLAIEKIDMVFKFDRCNFDTLFDTIYTYKNAKFVQNQSLLC